jgi:hypothetical protein
MSQFGPKADTGSLAAGDAATAWGVTAVSNSMNGDVRAAFHAHSNWLQVSFLEREYVVVAHHNAERIVPEDRHSHCGDGAALEDTAEAFIRGGDLGVGRIVLLLFQLIRTNCARCTGRLRVRCKTDP